MSFPGRGSGVDEDHRRDEGPAQMGSTVRKGGDTSPRPPSLPHASCEKNYGHLHQDQSDTRAERLDDLLAKGG